MSVDFSHPIFGHATRAANATNKKNPCPTRKTATAQRTANINDTLNIIIMDTPPTTPPRQCSDFSRSRFFFLCSPAGRFHARCSHAVVRFFSCVCMLCAMLPLLRPIRSKRDVWGVGCGPTERRARNVPAAAAAAATARDGKGRGATHRQSSHTLWTRGVC